MLVCRRTEGRRRMVYIDVMQVLLPTLMTLAYRPMSGQGFGTRHKT